MLSYEELSEVFDMDNPMTLEYFELVDSDCEQVKYTETHHILPRSMFPEYDKEPWNLVRLTYQQHYRAHEILPFICRKDEHRKSMISAWVITCGTRSGVVVNADQYAELKRMQSDMMSERTRGEKNYFYGKHWSGEQNPFFGKKHSEEHKEYIRQLKLSPDNPIRGKPQSEEAKMKKAIAHKLRRVPDSYVYAQYDKEDRLLRLWTDLEILDSGLFYKADLIKACEGVMHHHKGFKWFRSNTGYEYVCNHDDWCEWMSSEWEKNEWERLYGENGLGLDPERGFRD